MFDRFLSKKWRSFGRGLMSKLTHVRRERIVQKHCKIFIKMQIFMYHMHHRASSFLLKYQTNCIWKLALLRRPIFIGFGCQKFIKNCPKIIKKVIRKPLGKHMILEQIFNHFLTAFWLQFEIALPLDPSQEHPFMGPDFIINSHMSPMRFLMDVSSKSTTFASKKTQTDVKNM